MQICLIGAQSSLFLYPNECFLYTRHVHIKNRRTQETGEESPLPGVLLLGIVPPPPEFVIIYTKCIKMNSE